MERRKSYTASFKIEAINYSDIYGTTLAAAHFQVSDRMIRKWRTDKDKLKKMPKTKRAMRFKKLKVEDIEQELFEWVLECRRKNRVVMVKDIRKKAKILEDNNDFKASAKWAQSFMRRYKLSVRRRTSVGQPLPADHLEKCAKFKQFVQAETLDIFPHNLGNVDEVPVQFDIVYEKTVATRGSDSIKIDSTGHEKSNFTVVLGVTAAGERLKTMIIFKKKLLPKGLFPPDVIIKTNSKGWMTGDLMQEWIHEVWNKREHYSDDPSKSLLIFDSARCHLTDEVKEFCQHHTKIAVIPGGLTKLLQPLDVGINKPFKDHLRQGWERWMADENNAQYTKSGIRKRMSYSEAAFLVSDSFKAVTADVISHSFKKALLDDSEPEALNNIFNLMDLADTDEIVQDC